MDADIDFALKHFGKIWSAIEHNGKRLSREEVKALLLHGKGKGYKSISQLTDEEIDGVLLGLRGN